MMTTVLLAFLGLSATVTFGIVAALALAARRSIPVCDHNGVLETVADHDTRHVTTALIPAFGH